jgi:hypothetical protein
MFTYFIPLTVNLTKNFKLEKFVHELNALWKLSGSSMGALRELVAVADIDNNDDSKLDNVNDLKRPIMSYKITDDEINWKKVTETNTTVTEAAASAPEEELIWTKYDWNVMNKSNAALRSNIAEALEVSHSRYGK